MEGEKKRQGKGVTGDEREDGSRERGEKGVKKGKEKRTENYAQTAVVA